MILAQLGIVAPRGQRQQFGRELVSLVAPTQVQRGCLSCNLLQNWQSPDEFLIEANWLTEEDLIHHLQSDLYRRLLLLMDLSRTPPFVRFCTVGQVSGLELVERARNCAAIAEGG
jgi:quinol monooxygenase YgiN